MSISAAPVEGKVLHRFGEMILPTQEGEALSAPTTIGPNIAQGEDARASPHFIDASDK